MLRGGWRVWVEEGEVVVERVKGEGGVERGRVYWSWWVVLGVERCQGVVEGCLLWVGECIGGGIGGAGV